MGISALLMYLLWLIFKITAVSVPLPWWSQLCLSTLRIFGLVLIWSSVNLSNATDIYWVVPEWSCCEIMFCQWSTARSITLGVWCEGGKSLLNRIILSLYWMPHWCKCIYSTQNHTDPFCKMGCLPLGLTGFPPTGDASGWNVFRKKHWKQAVFLPTQNRLNLSSLNTLKEQKKSFIVFTAEQNFVLNVSPVSPDHRPQDATWGFAAQWGPHPCAPHGCPEAGGAEADWGRRKTLPCPFLWQQENLVSVCRELRVRRLC